MRQFKDSKVNCCSERNYKRNFDLQNFILGKAFNGTVVNWALPSLHGRSLEILNLKT